MRFYLAILLSAVTWIPNTYAASLMIDSNGTLQGASNVEVNGRYYDVSFKDGLLWDEDTAKSALFTANISDIANVDDAVIASSALINQVWTRNDNDYNRLLKPINGCSGSGLCQVITAYAYDATINKLSYAYANNYSGLNADVTGQSFVLGRGRFDTANQASYTLALWQLSNTTPVPEPSLSWLLVMGTGLICLYRRKENNA